MLGGKVVGQSEREVECAEEQAGSVETVELEVRNGGVTDQQIAMWKTQYRKVVAIEIEEDGDLMVGYFRRPNMEIISMVNKMAKTDEIKASNSMFDNCWLGGDQTMQTDAIVKMSAIAQISKLFQSLEGELKNL